MQYAARAGDIADRTPGADKDAILLAVGSDRRVGQAHLAHEIHTVAAWVCEVAAWVCAGIAWIHTVAAWVHAVAAGVHAAVAWMHAATICVRAATG